MAYILGILKTRDFDEWKAGFSAEENVAWRKEDGCESERAFQSSDDPNTVVVLLEWDNLDNARRHTGSSKLREKHQDLVVAPPEFYFLDEI